MINANLLEKFKKSDKNTSEAFKDRLADFVNIDTWTVDDLIDNLKKYNFKSQNSSATWATQVRRLIEFLLENGYENSERLSSLKDISINIAAAPEIYVDVEKLVSITLTKQEYDRLKKAYENKRDSIILQLAWYGLTAQQIGDIKTSDISIGFVDSRACCTITVKTKLDARRREVEYPKTELRTYKIFDDDLCNDIQKLIKTDYHIVNTSKQTNRHQYQLTDRLIKPISRSKNDKNGINVYATFRAATASTNVNLSGVDVEKLTLNDVARSAIVYDVYNGISDIEAKEKYNIKNSDLQLAKAIADIKYTDSIKVEGKTIIRKDENGIDDPNLYVSNKLTELGVIPSYAGFDMLVYAIVNYHKHKRLRRVVEELAKELDKTENNIIQNIHQIAKRIPKEHRLTPGKFIAKYNLLWVQNKFLNL